MQYLCNMQYAICMPLIGMYKNNYTYIFVFVCNRGVSFPGFSPYGLYPVQVPHLWSLSCPGSKPMVSILSRFLTLWYLFCPGSSPYGIYPVQVPHLMVSILSRFLTYGLYPVQVPELLSERRSPGLVGLGVAARKPKQKKSKHSVNNHIMLS